MKKILSKFKKILPSKRRLIQLYSALLFNVNLKGFGTKNPNKSIYTGSVKSVCSPGLNCYSCPGASGACPLGSMQNALYSSGKSVPYYIFGIILLYGIIFGRFICGFLCPFGLIQDLLHKIPTPKIKKNRVTKALSYLKYVILVFFVFIIPLVYLFRDFPLPGFCKYICPAGTLGGAIAMLINPTNNGLFSRLGPLFTWKFALLVSFIVGCIFIYRMFCRFICPLGALYGLFNRFAILGIKLDKPSCTECGRCIKKCKMDISRVGDHECINCGECISECPTGAIQWRGGSIILPKNEIPADASEEEKAAYEKKRKKKGLIIKIVAGTLAAVLLVGAFLHYNVFDDDDPIEQAAPRYVAPEFTFINYYSDSRQPQSVHSIDGVIVLAFINPAEDGSDEYIKTLNSLVSEVRVAEAEPWCSVLVVFDGCTADEMNEFVRKNAVNNFRNEAMIFVSDQGGSYRQAFSDIPTEDGTYLISRNKYIHSVLSKDSSTEQLKSAADLAYLDAVIGSNEGDICPEYAFKNLLGEGTINISDYAGKTIVLNFWFTDCGPCIEELPEFNKVAGEYANKDVVFIGVHQYSSVAKATPEYFAEKGWSNIIFVSDGPGEEFFKGQLRLGSAWPVTLVIDSRGIIYKKYETKVSEQQLVNAIEGAVQNAASGH